VTVPDEGSGINWPSRPRRVDSGPEPGVVCRAVEVDIDRTKLSGGSPRRGKLFEVEPRTRLDCAASCRVLASRGRRTEAKEGRG
jgi:hypothetical protein